MLRVRLSNSILRNAELLVSDFSECSDWFAQHGAKIIIREEDRTYVQYLEFADPESATLFMLKYA